MVRGTGVWRIIFPLSPPRRRRLRSLLTFIFETTGKCDLLTCNVQGSQGESRVLNSSVIIL